MKKIILSLGFLILVAMQINADGANGKCGSLFWSFNSTTGEIVISGSGAMPDYHTKKYYKPKKTCSYCYNYIEVPWESIKDEITSVVIKNGCTAIGDYAFSSCPNIHSVILPNTIKRIGERAFSKCYNLKSISIPEQVNEIRDEAFYECKNLSTIIWEARNCKLPSYWGNCPFARTNSKITSFIFGNHVTIIPAYLCYGLKYLKEVSIPSSVQKIGNSAFGNCDAISDVHISDIGAWMNIDFESVTSNPARYKHFYVNGKELEDLIIPQEVKEIKDYVFDGIEITSITFNHLINKISSKAFSQHDLLVIWNVTQKVDKKESGQSPLFSIRSKVTKMHFGENVDYISSYLCSDFPNLVSVTTSGNLKSIGKDAFFHCDKLESIQLNNGLMTIGRGAFNGCISLESIYIPPTTTTIENAAFYSCYELDAVYISDIEKWCKIDFEGYSSNPLYYAHNLYLNGEKIKNLIIPECIKEIKSHTFEYFSSLESVVINEGCTQIGNFAFAGDVNLKLVKLPSSLITIHEYAFARCSKLESIVLPEKVEYIGDDAFWLCSKMNLSTIPEDVKYIGHHAFCGCMGMKNLHVPASVRKIEKNAFDDVFNIEYSGTDKYAPWMAKSLNGFVEGDFVFKDVTKTTLVACYHTACDTIEIPQGVKEIGNRAFYACNKIRHIILPESIEKLGKLAFSCCRRLESINIPGSVLEIGDGAFFDCSNLKELTISENVASIGQRAFFGCRNIRSFSVETSNKYYSSIDGVLFNKTQTELVSYPAGKNDTSYIIPNGIKYIQKEAFWGNRILRSVTFPNSLLSIGDDAFWGCISLLNIQIPSKLETIGEAAFKLCTSLESLVIPSAVTKISTDAFYQCNGLKSINIKGQNTKIEDRAFFQCVNAIECTIPNQITHIGNDAFEEVPNIIYVGRAKGSPWGARSLNGWIKGDTIYSKNKKGEEIKIRRDLNWSSEYNIEPIFHLSADGRELFECSLNAEGELIVPDGVEKIYDHAFQNCGKITSVVIPNSVTTIEPRTFDACTAMKSVYLGKGVTKIEAYAFSKCLSLEKIVIPKNVRYIGKYVLSDCYNLQEIIVAKEADNIHCEEEAFYFCHDLQSISIPQNADITRSLPQGTDIIRLSTDSSGLELVPNSFIVYDFNKNGVVEVDEPCKLRLKIYNSGKGDAIGLRPIYTTDEEYPFLHIQEDVMIPNIPSGLNVDVDIPFYIDTTAYAARIPISISLIEHFGRGLKCPPISIKTTPFQQPQLTFDYEIYSESSVAQKTNSLMLRIFVRNLGMGIARNVLCDVKLSKDFQHLSGSLQQQWDVLCAGEQKEFSVKISSTENVPDSLNINCLLRERYNKYAECGTIPIVFGKTPTFVSTMSEKKTLLITGNPDAKMLSKTSVSVLKPEWYEKYNKPEHVKSPFPYAAIKFELQGDKEAVELAKQRLSLTMGGKYIVVEKDDTETNTIWFLVHCRNEFIELDCGDGCGQINIRKERLEPNKVYYGEIRVSVSK